MPGALTRILSDIHYADHASRVHRLAQLSPLFAGADALVLNGDTLDTRPGPHPEFTAACRTETLDFFARQAPPTTLITGNHDPDLSPHHVLDLADGRVAVTHGDIFFDSIVPWSLDAPLITQRLAAARAALPAADRDRQTLETQFALWRKVAAAIPQRHQAEKSLVKYAVSFATDTIWPPLRPLRILGVWWGEPARAAAFARLHRPAAKFLIVGHTHRPHITRTRDGLTVINTGAYCRPFGRFAVDVTSDHLRVRHIVATAGEFRLGSVAAEFALE